MRAFGAGEETGKTLTAAEQQRLREGTADEEAKVAARERSIALIQMIQAAIGQREAQLRSIGEEPGLQGDGGPQVDAALTAAGRTPVGRLALEELTDQALAREELEQLARLEEIEASVGSLENVANALDARCAELERRLARVVNGEVGDA